MCGITGIWGDADAPDRIRPMMDLMVHRGPDAEGLYASAAGPCVLGHRRLSIMDPAGGNQPILSQDSNAAIVANGEIYNYPRLFEELSQAHCFSTRSDSEAILHLYEDEGPSMVHRLDGMYAFAVSDGLHLSAARDPLGIKPLYYGEKGGAFGFASELKALTSWCWDIREFPPGTVFQTGKGFSTFYSVPDLPPEEAPLGLYLRRVRETLETAVAKRLMSDVPLGAFLSGGLDSSIIAALARPHLDTLHTFSVGIEGSPDLEAARVMARHLDTVHHEYVFRLEEVVRSLPEIIYHLESFDQDLVRSAIPCYFTSRLACQTVKVILTGEGADELFAGYAYYKGIGTRAGLSRELTRSVASLHNINLQRVDRMTMAHSIEGRVPFLDLEMVDLAQRIPVELKLSETAGVEKWILRKAFEHLLPEEILWRKKEQFDEGSGTVGLLEEALGDDMTAAGLRAYQERHAAQRLRSAEECYYHRIFMDVFDEPGPMLEHVGRWAARPCRPVDGDREGAAPGPEA